MTILFASDWQKYPFAIVDTTTKNVSWIRLAAMFRSMGIRNHSFILALHDPSLQGVDPHSPDLTMDQMLRVAMECKNNAWYFFREVARAPAIGGTDPGMLEANRGNIALFWLFLNHITQILIQPRQTGKSFNVDILMSLLMNIQCMATKINLLTKDDSLRRANIQRLKDIFDELPFYLRQRNGTDLNNTEEITVNALKNRYSTHVPQSSPKAALKMGRGLTTAIMHVDEAPFQPNVKIAIPAALGAMGAAIDKSAEEEAPYGIIFTTTAGKKDDKDGRYMYDMLSESAIYTEAFFDCKDLKELERMIMVNSRAGVVRVASVFNHRQLGKTDEWLMRKLSDAMQSGEDADRDFFNVWTSGTASNPIPVHLLDRVTGSQRGVVYTEVSSINTYVTRWYITQDEISHRMASGHYILGMDTSEASGGDDISLVVLDLRTLEVVAAGTYNETNLITFSSWVASWFVRFHNLTGIIERRSTGSTVLDYLLVQLPQMNIDPFKRLFNTVVHEHRENPERFAEIKVPMGRRDPTIYDRYKRFFGFATSGSGTFSRSNLYATVLQQAIKRSCDYVYDKSLIDQINGLIVKNGRVDHEVGEHDDMVIGWLLTHWLITMSVNLSYYGIDMSMAAKEVEAEVDMNTLMLRAEQLQLRNNIEKLTEKLKTERDEFVSMRLEQEIRILNRRIVYEENEVFSVDELIRQAKESKKNRQRLASSLGQYNPHEQSDPRLYNYAGFHNLNGPFTRI